MLSEYCKGRPFNDVTRSVLQRVVELCVTVRGFAFEKSCIELYRQAHSKNFFTTTPLCLEISQHACIIWDSVQQNRACGVICLSL